MANHGCNHGEQQFCHQAAWSRICTFDYVRAYVRAELYGLPLPVEALLH